MEGLPCATGGVSKAPTNNFVPIIDPKTNRPSTAPTTGDSPNDTKTEEAPSTTKTEDVPMTDQGGGSFGSGLTDQQRADGRLSQPGDQPGVQLSQEDGQGIAPHEAGGNDLPFCQT